MIERTPGHSTRGSIRRSGCAASQSMSPCAAGIEEFAEIFAGIADRVGIGDADAVEAERLRFARERGFQIGGGEFDGLVQKSRST